MMKLLRDIVLATCWCFLFLVVAEGALRVAGIKFEGSFYNPDRELGYVLRPNAEGWNVSENENYFRINSDGLADREHTLQRPPDVMRIAVVGDSVSEAKHVPREEAYWSVMERRLNSRLALRGQRVEVLNFGVAGYSLAQESIVIEKRVWKYDPQIILLAGTIESFVLRSSRRLSPNKASDHVPFYILRDGKLEPDAQTVRERALFQNTAGNHRRLGDMLNASRLLGLGNEASKKLLDGMKALAGRGPSIEGTGNAYRESDSFRGPVTPDLQAAWAVSEALILRARDESRRHHAEFWLFTLDMPQQVDPNFKTRSEFADSLGLPDAFVADRILADFATRQDIGHGTLAPQLLRFAEKNNVVLHGFSSTPRNSGHWNQIGHRVAGEMIARQLLESSPLFCCTDSTAAHLK